MAKSGISSCVHAAASLLCAPARKALALALSLVLVASMVPAAALTAFADAVAESDDNLNVQVEVVYGQTEARTMLDSINTFRTGDDAWYYSSVGDGKTTKIECSGLGMLVYDYTLEKIAMQRAAEIALSFSHTRPNGETCYTAYTGTWTAAGENIAAGYSSAQRAFTAWQETDEDYSGQGHRRNMLSSSYNAVAIGHVVYNGRHYWVQEFGYTSSLNTVATTAADSSQSVSVDIAASRISSRYLSATPSSLSVAYGSTSSLPELAEKIVLTDAWPSGTAYSTSVTGTWSSSAPEVATVSGGSVVGASAGSAVLTASYSDLETTVSVEVTPVSIASATVELTPGSYTYTGQACLPEASVAVDGVTLSQGTDYDISYANNIAAGSASVTVAGKGNYTGTASATFAIDKAAPSYDAPQGASGLVYSGSAQALVAKGTTGDGTIYYKLGANGAYSTDVPTAVNAGSYTVYWKLVGDANHTDVNEAAIDVEVAKAPAPTIVWPTAGEIEYGEPLSQSALSGGSTDFGTFAWADPSAILPAGEQTASVVFAASDATKRNYGEIETVTQGVAITVKKTSIQNASFGRIADQIFTGSAITPAVTVTLGGKELVAGTDYTVAYSGNVAVGTASVTVTGIGNYTGTATASFKIVAAPEPEPKPTDPDTPSASGGSWQTAADGTKTYRYADGELAKGKTKIDGESYYFDESTGAMQTGFMKIDKTSGKLAAASASADSYDVYYFRSSGVMVTGLARIYGYYRYFGDDGVRRYGAQDVVWSNVVNDETYADGTGVHSDGATHEMYFDDAGAKPTGTMLSGYVKIYNGTSGKSGHVDSDTAAKMADDSLYDVYYYRINGEKLYGLAKIYGYWRYLDPTTGVRLYGLQSVKWEGVTNDDAGNLAHNDGQVHEMFFDDAGSFPTGIMASGVFVRLNASGASDSSAATVYYFKIRGDMATGLVKVYGYLRCFDDDGVRLYGWQSIDGNTYYFDTYTGSAYTGMHEIDGTTYTFDANGVLVS